MSLRADKQVIVVGSGLAGLSAASQLVLQNVPVIMLDRAEKPGGNSIKASSGINGAPTKFQPCNDDEFFYADTIKSAGKPFSASSGEEREYRERLISTLINSSSDAITWLSDEKRIDLTRVAQLGGHSRPRTHRGAGQKPPGADIIGTLLGDLNGSDIFELRTNAQVTRVLQEGREVIGVEYIHDGELHHLHGSVVFASGGFAGDIGGMISKYRPDLASFPSTNEAREGSHPLLESVGAVLVDMEHVQVHPTGFIDDKDRDATVKFLAAEALRGEGGILLLNDGSRFVNELDTREHVTNAITGSGSRLETDLKQWDITLLLDEGAASALSSHVKFYLWKGLLRKTTVGELGQQQQITVKEYADVVVGKKADKFGRKTFGNWQLTAVEPDSFVYVAKVTPVLHFTMGGVKYNERSQVLDVAGEPIPGLWAAGEVTGGLHGQNRLAGSSLLECAVFGRIAGGDAASSFKQETRND